MADEEGANPNEQLLFASRTDNVELLHSLLSSPPAALDINHVDGLGNTALHYAAQHSSTAVLPELLEEEVDVDVQNRIAGDTPLHVAVRIDDEETRNWVVNQLLESGADPRIANKQGDKPVDVIVNASSPLGSELKDMLRKAEATAGFSADDVADDDDDDEGSEGTPSEE